MSRFEHAAYQNEGEAMKAIAHLPDLITRYPTADRLTAWPDLDQSHRSPLFRRHSPTLLETLNPFTFWAEAARLAWFPWLEVIRAGTLPPSGARPDLQWLA